MRDEVRRAKLRLLRMHWEAGVGHIGGNLSCLDILICLHRRMTPSDLFVLSKGHAAGALYVALWSIGALTDEDLDTFHGENTRLAGHPPPNGIPQILFATGSLGHGLPLAAGVALGRQIRNEPGRTFCLVSDGELNEGSTWESLIFSAHHRLEQLTIIVDANGLQGFGTTREVAHLGSLVNKIGQFVPATEIDGHDLRAIESALSSAVVGPHVIVARTRKGAGVSFMEDRMEWHYLPMTEAQYRQARDEVERS